MSDPIRIYHNARCSKSRGACELLREAGAELEVVAYLETPPTAEELRDLLAKLRMAPGDLVRRGEAVFQEHYAGRELDEAGWIAAMVAHPILIERPIVVRGDRALVARPPERALELLD